MTKFGISAPPALSRAATCLLLVVAGCGGQNSPSGGIAQVKGALTVLGMQYGEYLAQHGGAAPPDEATMRSFLESQLGELSGYGVKNVDDLLGASRDGKPLKVVCGAKVASPDYPDLPWAAYEQEGVDGTRAAVNSRGNVFELSAEEFARQVPIK